MELSRTSRGPCAEFSVPIRLGMRHVFFRKGRSNSSLRAALTSGAKADNFSCWEVWPGEKLAPGFPLKLPSEHETAFGHGQEVAGEAARFGQLPLDARGLLGVPDRP